MRDSVATTQVHHDFCVGSQRLKSSQKLVSSKSRLRLTPLRSVCLDSNKMTTTDIYSAQNERNGPAKRVMASAVPKLTLAVIMSWFVSSATEPYL